MQLLVELNILVIKVVWPPSNFIMWWEYQNIRKWGMTTWMDWSGSGYSAVAASCEHSNEPMDYIGGEFLDVWALASLEEFSSLVSATLWRCIMCSQWYEGKK